MKKLSVKLGLLFFIFILFIESMLFFLLYFSIINERVQSEIDNLLSRGMSHRDVLEKNFDSLTIKHVALMESEADTMVVITDHAFNILNSSNKISDEKLNLINESKSIKFSHHGEVLESRWKSEPFLATVSPVRIDEQITGYVYMFLTTNTIRSMIQNLTIQFLIVGGITLLFSVITIFFLSRFITVPLNKMKLVTEKLNDGKSDATLDIDRDDELGDLARSIQNLADDLERLKKDRSDFLSSISHELRTPLTYLKGYADILKRPNLTEDQRKEFIIIIEEEASNVSKLVKELFDLAKMDQNQFIIQKENIYLCEYLHDLTAKFKPAFEEKEISFHLTCQGDMNVAIDPVRFGQVLNNLLDNALKYSSANTNVRITAEKRDKQVIIKVTDQGEGIPKEDLTRIWDRLYRVDQSRSRAKGGSGLGLTIAKEIVERHGGLIEVQSELGKGTTFTICLEGE